MIKLSDVTVRYGQNTVYENFDMQFPCGVNVVLGKSGCGKTTLLNVVANLVEYSGKCEADGQVAMVLQQPCLAPVAVWKNIDAVLPRGNNTEKIQSVLAAVQLADKSKCRATELSGGEQQRVALARAFVIERPVLLLDEPFSNLDYGVRVQLRHFFNTLVRGDRTVVFVTHDIDDALAIADRIYLLQNSPCTCTQVAELSCPSLTRGEFDQQTLDLKKQLQALLL